MKIINLTGDSKLYTSNVYLVLGSWNAIPDLNTLIDTGSDEDIIEKIESLNTGLGKKKIDQILITHSHSDHTALLPLLKQRYRPMVFALNKHLPLIDHVLHDGDILKIGDSSCEVYHITSHSNDSACFLCEKEKLIFSGDTRFPIRFDNKLLAFQNEQVLTRLKRRTIREVFPGHGTVLDYSGRPFIVD